MTRLLVALPAFALTVSLSPAAHAFGTEPGPDDMLQVAALSQPTASSEKPADACLLPNATGLYALLGLSPEIGSDQDLVAADRVACGAK